jgi:hypothetical protein
MFIHDRQNPIVTQRFTEIEPLRLVATDPLDRREFLDSFYAFGEDWDIESAAECNR